MAAHRGEIIENVIRQSGMSINEVAKRLNITRSALYSSFKNANLSYDFIKKLGDVIHYNFSLHFAEELSDTSLSNSEIFDYLDAETAKLLILERKNQKILDKYGELLKIFAKVTNSNELKELKDEISEFLKENEI